MSFNFGKVQRSRKLSKILLILILLVISGMYHSFDAKSSNSTQNEGKGSAVGLNTDQISISIDNSITTHKSTSISQTGQVNTKKDQSASRIGLDGGPYNSFIESESKTPNDHFNFFYNETYSQNFTDIGQSGTFDVRGINGRFDEVEMNLTAGTKTAGYQFDTGDVLDLMSTNTVFAQAVLIPELHNTSSIDSVNVSSFYVESDAASAFGVSLTGAVWLSNTTDASITPSTEVTSTTITTSGNLHTFHFTNSPVIKRTDIFSNSSGGYIFFLFYAASGADVFDTVTTGQDDGPTYETTYTTTPGDSGWGSTTAYDIALSYNATFQMDALNISTQIDTQNLSGPNYFYQNDTKISVPYTYTLTYNSIEAESLTVYFNITSISKIVNDPSVQFSYVTDPADPNINWTLTVDNPYTANVNSTMYFLIPKNFTSIYVYNTTHTLVENTDYTINSNFNSANQSIILSNTQPSGTYTLSANSTNMFDKLLPSTYKWNGGGWTAATNATMGIIVPSQQSGDWIQANVTDTDVSLLGINSGSGTVNASLRSETGIIQKVDHTRTYTFNNYLEFNVSLVDHLDIGTYSFQFRWFNGTSAGAIAVDFNILPNTTLNIVSPTPSFNALEGSSVNLDVNFINNSTNSNFTTAGTLNWVYGPIDDPLTYISDVTGVWEYSTTLDLTGVNDGVYTLNVTFSESLYSISVFYTMTVYLSGIGSISNNNSPIDWGNDQTFDFQAINVSDGSTAIQSPSINFLSLVFRNSTNDNITLNDGIDYSWTYEAAGVFTYHFTINFNSTFTEKDITNTLFLRWNYLTFRENADVSYIETSILVTYEDRTPPTILGYSDQTITETQSKNFVIQWNISDYYPDTYTLLVNDYYYNATGPWNNNVNVTFNLGASGLLKGTYKFNMTAQDIDANVGFYVFTLTVTDPIFPAQNGSSPNLSSFIGNKIYQINWTFTDTNPDKYVISVNSVQNTSGSWFDNVLIPFDVSYFNDGSYNIEISVNDTSNHVTTISFTLDIDLTAAKDTTNLADYTFDKETTSGNQVNWTIVDPSNPDLYIVERNGTVISTVQPYTSGLLISFNVDYLDVVGGKPTVYNFTISVVDLFGNTFVDTIYITVEDVTAPFIDSGHRNPAGGSVNLNDGYSPAYTISWNFTDYQPSQYDIYVEDAAFTTGSVWSNPNAITFTPLGQPLSIGTHNFTIVIWDLSGNSYKESVFIYVVDDTPPDIQGPLNVIDIGEHSTTGINLTFSVFDTTPNNYTLSITYDGAPFNSTSGNWTQNNPPSYPLDGLSIGTYIFNLTAFDQTGLNSSILVTVMVYDDAVPQFNQAVNDLKLWEDDLPYNLNWGVYDQTPYNYWIMRNGSLITPSGGVTWTGTSISYTIVQGLEPGIYEFTITLNDSRGLMSSSSFVLKLLHTGEIESNAAPNLDIANEVYTGEIEEVTGNWTALVTGDGINGANITANLIAISVTGVDSGTIIKSLEFKTNTDGTFTLTFDYSRLAAGSYRWNITYSKVETNPFAYYTPKYSSYVVNVLAQNVDFDLDHPPTLVQGQNFTIVVYVTYSTPYLGGNLGLDTITSRVKNGTAVSGVTVLLNLEYETADGARTLPIQAVTNAEGIAYLVLTGKDTNDITKIVSFTLSLVDANFVTSGNRIFSSPNIAIEVPTFDLVAEIRKFMEQYWMYVVAAIVGIIILSSILVRQSRKRKQKRARTHRELEFASDEIGGIISLQAIILKHSETGIPFYYKTFEEEEDSIDPSLISSLTTAISTFLSELQEGSMGFETMERQGISLSSHRGELSDFIVISKDPLPLSFFEEIQTSHKEIEDLFREDIANPVMVQEIEEVFIDRSLIRNGFKIDLKGFLDIDVKKIKKIKDNQKINRNVRSNIDFLRDFANSVQEANLPITLSSMMDYLESMELSRDVASRLIVVAYNEKVISSKKEE